MRPTLYIANRGEIARRIIRTAKKMGFKTAVGYANQDKELPFVLEADEALPLDGEDSAETYLNSKKVLDAALKAKASHLHPGYGFLSENPSFVDLINANDIHFVGPSSESMRLLGDKIGSRNFLKKLDVPLLPSYEGADQSAEMLLKEAERLGFPLLIKPSAGGGGKGMLRVNRAEDFLENLESSRRTSKAAFGDARVFLERLIEKARHIEVQILGEVSGEVHVLGERECSLQKRHQKVIEEAPCDFLPSAVRERIFKASKEIAEKAKYSSLGTVEWIWDGKDGIYFLEVNARLQVEHPVTEFVWGVDLVELQLRVAKGESLGDLSLKPNGHSIECRLCAEDPSKDFLPSGGKIHRLKVPQDLRVDFGYAEKNTIPSHFDSLMGKIISYAETREAARLKMISGLKELCVFGPATNRGFLLHLLEMNEFKIGNLSTDLISKTKFHFDFPMALHSLKNLKNPSSQMIGEEDLDFNSPWGSISADRSHERDFFEDFGEKRYFHTDFADWSLPRPTRQSANFQNSTAESLETETRSPMPARVVKILIKKGERVRKGDLLLVLEAMKMEHQIKATREAQIAELLVKEGERVQMDAVLVRWEK